MNDDHGHYLEVGVSLSKANDDRRRCFCTVLVLVLKYESGKGHADTRSLG